MIDGHEKQLANEAQKEGIRNGDRTRSAPVFVEEEFEQSCREQKPSRMNFGAPEGKLVECVIYVVFRDMYHLGGFWFLVSPAVQQKRQCTTCLTALRRGQDGASQSLLFMPTPKSGKLVKNTSRASSTSSETVSSSRAPKASRTKLIRKATASLAGYGELWVARRWRRAWKLLLELLTWRARHCLRWDHVRQSKTVELTCY